MNAALRRIARIASSGLAVVAVALAGACGAPQADPSPSGSASSSTASDSPIVVVASVNQWGSLAKQIGGDYVDVTSILASSTVEAHDFEPQGSDIARIAKANVVVANGAGYDTWATKAVTKGKALVTAAENVGASDGDNPHLWFSKDARKAMAQDLADTYAKIQPDHKDYFDEQLSAWQSEEADLEDSIAKFSQSHRDATYAATESVAKYLLADMGLKDVTPRGYAQASANESEPAPADLGEMTSAIEAHEADVLVNNPQETSDTTNMITGVAHKSDVPVIDVTEQMPEGKDTLVDWIADLVASFDSALDTADASQSPSASESASESASPSGSASTTDAPPDPGK